MHRNKGVSSSKMQNDLTESEDRRGTADPMMNGGTHALPVLASHRDLFRHLRLLRLQYSNYNHLVRYSNAH